jgi:bacterial microcompartment shell protein
MQPAVGLLEFDSIARGIEAGDAMAKRAPLDVIRAGTVHPGKYLVLVGGLTADVEEALQAGREVGAGAVTDEVFLPDVHADVVASIGGTRREDGGEALGIIETRTVAAVIDAADAGVKAARVVIRDLRLADDLGGKGYVLFGGEVAEVEAAIDASAGRIASTGQDLAHVVIAQLHGEMRENLTKDPRFAGRVRGAEKTDGGPGPSLQGGPPPGGRPLPGTGGAEPGRAKASRLARPQSQRKRAPAGGSARTDRSTAKQPATASRRRSTGAKTRRTGGA